MSLIKYKSKRNFNTTPEPKAEKGVRKPKRIFVIQRHYASHLHYDFRLEMDGVLKSWAVPKGPSLVAGEKRLAVMVEDHPLQYGKFYGDIPQGNYGAGNVEIWDSGTYTSLMKTEDDEETLLTQLKKGDLKIVLNGKHLKGAFALVRMGDEKNWLLIKKEDKFALEKYDIAKIDSLKVKNKKVTPKKSTEQTSKKKIIEKPEIKISKFPTTIPKPMLAKLSEKIIHDEEYIFEIKYDGYRMIAAVENAHTQLLSRNANSYTALYHSISEELNKITDNIILDGEIVLEDINGRSDFQMLQNFRLSKKGNLKYYVFDILFLNNHSTCNLTLIDRKILLELFFEKYNFTHIHLSKYETGNWQNIFEKYANKGYEGLIAKLKASHYYPDKRTDNWLKIKNVHLQEVIIAGYTQPQNSRQYFGSLILGIFDNNKLKYIGNCGTGFSDTSLKELHQKFEKLKSETCPFPIVPKMTRGKGKAIWLQAQLVCNVKYLEWTQDKHLRNPVFMGIREDKNANDVIPEIMNTHTKSKAMKPNESITISNKKVNLTNLEKIYWTEDEYTKCDLIHYYNSISSYILPYLKNRPQSLHRHPNGINQASFYQKDMDTKQLPTWLKTEKIYSKSNKAYLDYLICNNKATLLYMANLGCIEINPWHSVLGKLETPTYMILDLDPADIDFKHVIETANVIKELCDEIGIDCYCKTSGATGLHIYIPLANKYNYDEVKTFAEILANITHQRLPDITSIERSTAKRKDKIYIDYLQNNKGQTIAAPYSVRPQIHATVSAPLLWKEVNSTLSPSQFTIKNMEARLKKVGDLWNPVLKKGIDIHKVLKAIDKIK